MRVLVGIFVVVAVGTIAVGITITAMVFAWPGCQGPNSPSTPDTPDTPDNDPYRPLYHYTPAKNWVNDPNGLIHYKGEFHMYYQYDMYSDVHSDCSWGHAVSTDLVHWKELDVAIPSDDKEQIFSGSMVVDEECTSNLCDSKDSPIMVAAYTSWDKLHEEHIQSQHIAVSKDLGRTFQKYEHNPVLDENNPEFRDPKIIRYNENWIMLVQRSNNQYLMFYESPDLINWGKPIGQFPDEGQRAGNTDGVWECPDMFDLPVDGDLNNMKTVLIVNINPGNPNGGSAGQYFLGKFDGTKFVNDDKTNKEVRWLDYGMDYYATITWATPERISIGWMANWVYTEQTPTHGWRNSFSSPRQLKLKTIDGKVTLTQLPVSYLDTLKEELLAHGDKVTVSNGKYTGKAIRGRAVDIEVTFTNKDAKEFGVRVHAGENQETLIGYDVARQELFVDRTKSGNVTFNPVFPGRHAAPLTLATGKQLKLRILVDHNSVEAFAGEGEVAISDSVYPDPTKNLIDFYANSGSAVIDEFHVWRMGSFKK